MTASVVDVARQFTPLTQHETLAGYWVHLTASGQVFAGPAILLGFRVNSTTSGTLVLGDALTATNPVSGTITPALGWNQFPGVFKVGIYATIAGTALDVSFLYQA